MIFRVLLTSAALALSVAGPVSAATVQRDADGAVVYSTDPGAQNLLVDVGTGGVRITDAGAAATLPEGCSRLDEANLWCDATSARVLLGDGDDRLEVTSIGAGIPLAVDGGAGRDFFTAYSRRTGDEGPITLTLGGGADDGFPGQGDDIRNVETISATSPGRIVGTAADEHLYGVASATDSFTLEGGAGDDELRAPGGTDHLDGGPGDDTLIGGFGKDTLVGGPGRDRVYADTAPGYCEVLNCTLPQGNDRIDVRDGERDVVTCGPGRDLVIADAGDRTMRDCEVVRRAGRRASPKAVAAQIVVPGQGRLVQRRYTLVRASVTREVKWHYLSTDVPGPCVGYDQGIGVERVAYTLRDPAPYTLMRVGRQPWVFGPEGLVRYTGEASREQDWKPHVDECGVCGGELGDCGDIEAPPTPARPQFDCAKRKLLAAQLHILLAGKGQKSGLPLDIDQPEHDSIYVEPVANAPAFANCPPTHQGGPGLPRFADGRAVFESGEYRRLANLRPGGTLTLQQKHSSGETLALGDHQSKPVIGGRCPALSGPGRQACLTVEVELTIRRER
jgi:hypothetical protein